MIAQELRIGNWVNDYYGTPRQVEYLTTKVIALSNDIGGVQKYQNNPIFSHDIKDLKGIPLSEDILIKAGFVKIEAEWADKIEQPDMVMRFSDNEEHRGGKEIFIALGNSPYEKGVYVYSGLGDPESYGFKVEVKYLHQLQNLYFALTGEELDVPMPL